ncbi:glutathione S-transferase N-terminal domain-containing protein [Sphingosinicella sp. YJ22]|uniref:glutathione S-transferase family protein n=1 Tax=Sphingosinicella sp. YJ22 TaxID=1104780 RepID=UPI00140AAA4F|nr:glutathione S-transferase N-terminal domain-containing protein [Sphingosinicella sp. YJ22]
MRLIVTRASPYARKTRAAVIELGLEDRVEIVEVPIRLPQQSKPDVEAVNPLGKIPVLELDDGRLIADSPVIVAYLDDLAGGGLIPRGADKWRVLTLEALADGCMDAGFVLRMEQLKAEERRDPAEVAAYTAKIERTLDRIEQEPHWLAGDFNVGQLALACALDWIVFRGLVADPLAGRPRLRDWLAATRGRPSLAATRPST